MKTQLFSLFAILLLVSPASHAATRTWTGGGANNNWTTAANWDVAVAVGDNLVFPGGAVVDATSLLNTNDFGVATTFGSITLSGTNYTLRGSAIILTNGITHTSGDTNTLEFVMALQNHQTFSCTTASGQLVIAGNGLTLNGENLTNNVTGRIHISSSISGSGNLIKTGIGTLQLLGNSGNAYTGSMTVQDGLLELAKTPGLTAISGALTIGDGVDAVDSAIVRLLVADQIINSSTVTIEDDGQLELNGFSDVIGALTFVGGDVTTGAGTLTLGGDVTALSATNTAQVSGVLSLGNVTRTFNVSASVNPIPLFINAQITGGGSAGIIKSGQGRIRLVSSNSFPGVVTVNGGQFDAYNSFALGTTNAGTVVTSNSTLGVFGGVHMGLESLTLDADGLFLDASFVADANGASNSWAGNITLGRNTTLYTGVNSTMNLLGAIGGTGDITNTGPGTMMFSGTNANTYSGITTVKEGTLLLDKSAGITAIPGALIIGNSAGGANADVVRLLANSQISDSSAVTLTSSGLLDTESFTEVVGALSGAGNLQLDASVFSVGFLNSDVIFDGTISGTGSLIRNGTGNWILNGSNTFSGNSTLNANTIVNGTLPANSISVSGTLGGTGTVGRVSMAVNGTLAPGFSPGRLTTSNLNFIVTSKYHVELNGTTPGSGYDQLKVNGSVNNLASATLNASLGFPSAISNVFTIIDNDGTEAVTNTFLGLGEGATLNISGTPFRISYVGGTGNDVTLTQLTATQQPLLNIRSSGATNVVLSWPTNFPGYTLEANTNLNPIVWSAVTNPPVVSGTNNVVTNTISDPQSFYRLIQD